MSDINGADTAPGNPSGTANPQLGSRDQATIQVSIHDVRQLFNSIDPSPFRERDLDPACEEFIVSWAHEFPPDRPLRIEIRLDRERPPSGLLADVSTAVHSHFARSAGLQALRRRRLGREGRFSLAIGLATLILCIGGATFIPTGALGAFGEILTESLIIAGWVVMWHPLEVLLYGLWPVERERRLLERLAGADVHWVIPATADIHTTAGER